MLMWLTILIFLPGDDAKAVDEEGFLNDVQVQSIDDTTRKYHADKTANINAFFSKLHTAKSKDSKSHNVQNCDVCQYV